MASEMMWVGERTIFDKSSLRQKFKLQWVAWYVTFAILEREGLLLLPKNVSNLFLLWLLLLLY